jgi:hypothetical protein
MGFFAVGDLGLSPIGATTTADQPAKPLFILVGGEGGIEAGISLERIELRHQDVEA